MKNLLFAIITILLFVLMIMSFAGCDTQVVEPEVVMAETLNKPSVSSTPFPYLQEFNLINSSTYTWWVSNDTVFVKFINNNLPPVKNYFIFVEHSNYTVFYYLHTIQAFTAIPYIGNTDVENIKLYGIRLE